MAVLKYNGEYISGSGEISMKLTQAQYDALSEGQKNNGTTYFVETEDDNWDGKNIKYNDTQSVTGAIDSLNDTITKITETQTNTEEKIGKYAGNDLYRQRFSGQLSGTTKQISTITTNQIQIVSAKGTINTSDYSAQMPLNSYWDNSWNNGMIINSAGTYINVCSTLSNGYYDVTLEYIKK